MPDVIDLLKRDHREVEQLFGAFERDPQPSIAGEICAQLELHTTAEEHFVYPALRERVSDGKKLAEVVAELQKAIEHHVEEEEETVFPKMESDLGKIELEAIGANVQEFKGSA